MKHDHIEPHHTDTSIPHLSDAEIEALVFRNLEARRMAWDEERKCSVVVLQNPDTRTVFQRLSAWWSLRFRHRDMAACPEYPVNLTEPAWPGHWATSKYL